MSRRSVVLESNCGKQKVRVQPRGFGSSGIDLRHHLAAHCVVENGAEQHQDFARLFDTLAGLFKYIVVDASSRLDSATRVVSNLSEKVLLVAHADVAALWSAGRVAQYLGESGSRDRFALVLNRYRKVAGFNEAETEAAIGAPVLWRIPNQYFAVATAIDRGVPLMQQGNTEIARSISGLADYLTRDDLDTKRTAWSLFKTV